MPTFRSHSTARSAASRFPHTLCAVNTSATCSPTVSTGFRDDIGSWKIIEIDFPRTPHIRFSGRASRSSPRNRISPPSTTAGGDGRSRRIDSAVTVLPHPDSPTSPTVSAGATEKETPKRARTVPSSVPKESRSPRTSSSVSGISYRPFRRGSAASRIPSPSRLYPSTVERGSRARGRGRATTRTRCCPSPR